MSDWTNKLVEFEKDLKKADTIRPETFTADQEWFLCRHVVTETTNTVKTEGSSANDYPLYHIRCHVKRKNGYYLWNIAMIIVSQHNLQTQPWHLLKADLHGTTLSHAICLRQAYDMNRFV